MRSVTQWKWRAADGLLLTGTFLALTFLTAAWPSNRSACGEENKTEKQAGATTAEKTEAKPLPEQVDEAKRVQDEYEAEQRALEKQIRDDPAWQPSHVEIAVIHVKAGKDEVLDDFVHTFCLDPEGNVLLGCGGVRQEITGDEKTEVIKTHRDPTELRRYTPEGKLLKAWKVATEPQAICVLPDGTIFVAGDGKLLKLDAEGKQLAEAPLPSLAHQAGEGSEEARRQEERLRLAGRRVGRGSGPGRDARAVRAGRRQVGRPPHGHRAGRHRRRVVPRRPRERGLRLCRVARRSRLQAPQANHHRPERLLRADGYSDRRRRVVGAGERPASCDPLRPQRQKAFQLRQARSQGGRRFWRLLRTEESGHRPRRRALHRRVGRTGGGQAIFGRRQIPERGGPAAL